MLGCFINMTKVLDFFEETLKINEIRNLIQNLKKIFFLEAFFNVFEHFIGLFELLIK